MPLDLPSLKTALENAFGVSQVSDVTASNNIKAMADTIATAIDTYVKTGTVNSTGTDSHGDAVTTTGTIS